MIKNFNLTLVKSYISRRARAPPRIAGGARHFAFIIVIRRFLLSASSLGGGAWISEAFGERPTQCSRSKFGGGAWESNPPELALAISLTVLKTAPFTRADSPPNNFQDKLAGNMNFFRKLKRFDQKLSS